VDVIGEAGEAHRRRAVVFVRADRKEVARGRIAGDWRRDAHRRHLLDGLADAGADALPRVDLGVVRDRLVGHGHGPAAVAPLDAVYGHLYARAGDEVRERDCRVAVLHGTELRRLERRAGDRLAAAGRARRV